MRNYKLLRARIDDGIRYIEAEDKKLTPVLDYLTEYCITHKEELPPDKCFDYLIQFMKQKTECLLLLTKMQEIIDYTNLEEK